MVKSNIWKLTKQCYNCLRKRPLGILDDFWTTGIRDNWQVQDMETQLSLYILCRQKKIKLLWIPTVFDIL